MQMPMPPRTQAPNLERKESQLKRSFTDGADAYPNSISRAPSRPNIPAGYPGGEVPAPRPNTPAPLGSFASITGMYRLVTFF